MIRVDSGVPAFLMLVAVTVLGCGGNGGDPRAAEKKAPSDAVMPNGFPIYWVAALAVDGPAREYYEGVLRKAEIGNETRGLLVMTGREAGPPTSSYELTEYRFEDYGLPIGGYAGKFLGATKSMGTATAAEGGVGYFGPELVYRLDGGASPTNAHLFLWTPFRMEVAEHSAQHGRPIRAESRDRLALAATAARGRVEIRDMVDRYLYWGIRLRVGEELVARLTLYNAGCAWELKPETAGTLLRQQGARADERDRGGNYDVFTFRAVEPGATDLVFDYRLADGKLSSPYSTRVVVN